MQAGDEVAVVRARPERAVVGRGEGPQEADRVRVAQDEERPEHEADVADDVDDERLDAGSRGRRAPVPEGDQQVGGCADERPADDEDDEVAGQHEQQHREDEEVQVREVAIEPAVLLHVGDRVQVDERRHAADREDHEHRQRVDENLHARVEPGDDGVVPQRRGHLAVRRRQALQLDERDHRGDEAEEDRGGGDPARRSSRPHAETEPAHERAHEREQEDQPGEGRGVHRGVTPAARASRRRRSPGCGGRWPPPGRARSTPRRRRR